MATAVARESFSNAQKSNSNHKNAKDDDDDREMIAFPPSTIILSFQLNGNQLLLERKWHVRNRFKSRDWNK